MKTPTARRGSEAGFTLIELLVVIVIIGILAAIAVPVFLHQRAKGHDTAARSDLKNLALYIMGEAHETNEVPTVEVDDAKYVVNGNVVVAASPGVVFGGITGTSPDDWCIDMTHPEGSVAKDPGVKYSATEGYADGQCS